jgi:hypothetical protein
MDWKQWVDFCRNNGPLALWPSDHLCQHAVEISQLPWFQRLWIIQEFVLAFAHPRIILRDFVTIWLGFFKALNRYHSRFMERSDLQINERYQAEQLQSRRGLLQNMRARRGVAPGLFECTAMSRGVTAKDPRDRVYGLLVIVRSRVAEPIVADYSKAWPQVLAEATIVMISEDGVYPYMRYIYVSPSTDCSIEGHRTPS